MAKPGYNYTEPECCGTCDFAYVNKTIVICQNKKQEKLKGNKVGGSGYFPTNELFVECYGKCDLYKRSK